MLYEVITDLTLGASTPTGIAANRCGTGTVALSASGAIAGEVYKWYDAANTPMQTNASPNFTTPSIAGTATYYVAIYNATGNCESTRIPVTATVNPLPTVFTVGGGGVSCSGAGVNVVLSGSEAGVNYQLRIGGADTGSPLAGTGSALTFNNLTVAGTYTIIATNASTSCSENMIGSAVITTGAAPSQPGAFATSTASVCQGVNNIVYTVPNVAGVTYTWSYSGTGATINGTGNSITIDYSNSATSGTLSVTASNACGTSIARTVNVTVNSLPTQPGAFTTSSSTVCQGQNNVTYTIPAVSGATSYNWTYSGTGATISGTGTSVNLSFSTTATSGTLSVTATNTCGTSPAQTVAINVTPLPAQPAAFTTSSANVCSGQSNVAFIVPDDPTVNYIWNYGGTGATITNTRGSALISFDGTATSGTLSVTATNGCGLSTSRTINITVNPLPTVFNVTGGGTLCSGGAGTPISLSGSQTGVSYQLKDAANSNVGAAIVGTGAALNFGNIAVGGTYTVLATNTTTTCNLVMNGSAIITVDPVSVGGTVNTSTIVCSGTNSGTLTLAGHTGNVIRWESSINGGGSWNTIANTTTSQTYTNLTANTLYRAVVKSGVCAEANSASATITIDPVSVGGTVSTSAAVCTGANNGTLTLSGHTGNLVRWESSTNGGGSWNNITNTSTTLNYVNITATTLYRAVVQNGSCATANSNTATIAVNPLITNNSITDSPITQNCGASTFIQATTPSGGNGSYNYQWESSPDNSAWTTIGGANSQGLSTGTITSTTYFRRIVTSGGCSSMSNVYSITITTNPFTSNTISVNGPSSGCTSVAPWSLEGDFPSGGYNSTYSFQWFSSVTSPAAGFASIPGATGQQYIPGTLTQTTYFKRVATSGGCSFESNVLTISITGVPTAAISYSGSPFCSNSTTIQTVTQTGATGGTYSAPAGLSINSVTGDINPSLSTPNTYTVTYIIAATGSCPLVTATTSVIITPAPAATISYAGSPFCMSVSVPQSVTLTGTAGGTYSAPAGLTLNSSSGQITPSTSTQGTYTVSYTVTSSGCTTVTTTTVVINLVPTVAATPLTQETLCNGNAISAISISNPNSISGTTFTWTRNKTVEVSGIAASGSGSSITGSLTNTTNSVQVVDFTITASANGCSGNPVTVSVTVYPTMILTMVAKDVSCTGGSDGEITLTVSGGKPPYQFTINDGANYFPAVPTNTPIYSFSNLLKGTYNVIVRDSNGCTAFPCQLP